MPQKTIRIAQVGFGMFGSHEVARSLESVIRYGVAPFLGRVGYPDFARPLAPVEFEMVAIGTHSERSGNRAADQFESAVGKRPQIYTGDTPWIDIINEIEPDVLVVATPDDCHFEPALHAIRQGIHVLVEKPLALHVSESSTLVREAEKHGVLLGSDNHKEYDPDHLFIAGEILPQIGPINYGRAYLEEPLAVSTSTFKWIAEAGKLQTVSATPFSYVGIHWVSLFQNLYGTDPAGSRILTPVSVSGHGQKNLLLPHYGIDAVDSTVVQVVYDTGTVFTYENSWITPEEFCGLTVNQGHEIVGANGKIESDQQNRGLIYWVGKDGPNKIQGALSQRSANTHFFRSVYSRHQRKQTCHTGYGMDAIVAFLAAAARLMMHNTTYDEVRGTFVDGASQILPCAVIEAGNAAVWKNQDLLLRRLAPTGMCTIDIKHGIELSYQEADRHQVTQKIFEGPLL